MRSIGQSVGILWKAIREPANPNESATHTEQVSKEVREERQGNVTLRETTIREIEYHDSDDDHSSPSSSTDDQPTRSIESNPEAEQDRK